MAQAAHSWNHDSWQDKPARQQPEYPDQQELETVLRRLAEFPPLVTSWEVRTLKDLLAEATAGNCFLLQGGDCAERFDECQSDVITSRLKILLQMSLVLVYGLKKKVVRVGRFAGQYAKPRSSTTETRDGVTLPSYRGDIINGQDFTREARRPNPLRLMQAYSASALTLNFVRALTEGGFADLHHPEYWNLDFVEHSPLAAEYEHMVGSIGNALNFIEAVTSAQLPGAERTEFYTSHEALHLHYEQALTRTVPHTDGAYNLGTHFPWIGKRTAHPDDAHVEYARGISNPIGVKVGTDMTPERLQALARMLNPDEEPGRLTFITRFGVDEIERCLPPLIEAAQSGGHVVLWVCDPMHGNTERTASGRKTRHFDKILQELELAFDIHAAQDSHLGGVHFELTGEAVTECVGGARGLAETDLERAYTSYVDPRLNGEQALEMALRIIHKQSS